MYNKELEELATSKELILYSDIYVTDAAETSLYHKAKYFEAYIPNVSNFILATRKKVLLDKNIPYTVTGYFDVSRPKNVKPSLYNEFTAYMLHAITLSPTNKKDRPAVQLGFSL